MKKKEIFLMFFLLVSVSQSHAQGVSFTSSNLPVLILTTNSQNAAGLTIINNGNNQRNNLTDEPAFQGMIQMHIADSAAFFSSKQSFEFVTTDTAGNPRDVGLLGLEPATRWVLDALGGDKSYLRTFLGFEISRKLGNFAPALRFCELVINNEYWGLYLFKEVIAPGKNRLRIAELDSDDVSGDSLTGGFILKVTEFDSQSTGGWLSDHLSEPRIFYQFHYPAAEKIRPEQVDFIQNIVKNFELVMESSGYEDSYSELINLGNFANFAIVTEISRPPRSFGLHSFLYYDGQQLHAGPVWNFNSAFDASWNGWEIKKNPQPFWWSRLAGSRAFLQTESYNWYRLRRGQLTNMVLDELIARQVERLVEAEEREWLRWWVPFFPPPPSEWEPHVRRLEEYLDYRIDWLDHVLMTVEPGPQSLVSEKYELLPIFPNPFNASTRISWVLAQSSEIRLEIFDATGRRVCTLAENREPAGIGGKTWNGTDQFGAPVSSGIYFCRFRAGNFCESQKMVLLR